MIRDAIVALVEEGRSLSEEEATAAMREIMDGEASEAQFGAFVTALRLKGETADEITGMARVMREKSLHVSVSKRPLLDTCGTGGSPHKTFNVSTAAAFVAAACGATVAKHGNRAATSKAGSADVLEVLGAKIALTPEQVAACIEQTGVGFMFAQAFHPAMKFAGPLRPQIGIRTVFNILGPLTNPASANCHVLGVPNRDRAATMAEVLGRLGMRHALVVSSEEGLDEISVSAPTHAWEVKNGQVAERTLRPADFGVSIHPLEEVLSGNPEENAATLRAAFSGNGSQAIRDFIVVNASAGLYVTGLASSFSQGAEMAKQAIDSGDAAARVGAFVEATRRVAEPAR